MINAVGNGGWGVVAGGGGDLTSNTTIELLVIMAVFWAVTITEQTVIV